MAANAGTEKQVEKQLVSLTNEMYKSGVTIAFGRQTALLGERINRIVALLSDLDAKCKSGEIEKEIPMNFIEVVDAGVNPDLVQRQQLQTLVDKNQKTNGRIQSLRLFKEELEAQMAVNYPEILEAFYASKQ
ncbi:hypothetical protein HDV03_002609 [Kappamyces sp. JEL0829]|nr:hypothetical protein HDV03_002609 [Kappamyces sp. JEL0829]KAJ3345665.1 hypothetical protein HDU91_007282 [Kappamyces sp. JEL0680]